MPSPTTHELEVSVIIHAEPATVFRFFTDPARFERWLGAGSLIGAVGGDVKVCFQTGDFAAGTVRELVPNKRVVFTWGYAKDDAPIKAGSTTVTVLLDPVPGGTRVTLRHEGLPTQDLANQHVGGWRFYLAMLANRSADEQYAGVQAMADAWLAAWNERDGAARVKLLERCCAPAVTFRDAWGIVNNRDELAMTIGIVQMHDPQARIEAVGKAAQAHGTAHFAWKAVGGRAGERGGGHNIARLGMDGKFVEVVGIWEGA